MQRWSLYRGLYTGNALSTAVRVAPFTETRIMIRNGSVEIEHGSVFRSSSRSFVVSGNLIAPFFAELKAMEIFSDRPGLCVGPRNVRKVLRELARDISAHPEKYRQELLQWQRVQLWPAHDKS